MMVRFIDNESIHIHDLRDESLEPDYCTILYIDGYTVKLFHSAYGIGMSDRYDYDTVAEVYFGGDIVTHEIATNLGIQYPIDDMTKINQLLKWLYS